MTALQKKVLNAGIQIKLDRGEELETILAAYIKLTDEEKHEIREHFN